MTDKKGKIPLITFAFFFLYLFFPLSISLISLSSNCCLFLRPCSSRHLTLRRPLLRQWLRHTMTPATLPGLSLATPPLWLYSLWRLRSPRCLVHTPAAVSHRTIMEEGCFRASPQTRTIEPVEACFSQLHLLSTSREIMCSMAPHDRGAIRF